MGRARATLFGLMQRLRGRKRPRGSTLHFHERLISWMAVFHPDVHLVAMASPSHTVLRVDRQEVQVDLQGLHDWFLVEPDRLGEILDHFLSDLVEELRNRPLPPLDTVIDHLYPQIRPFSFLKQNSPRFGRGRLVRLPLIDSTAPLQLRVLYVIDEGQAYTFVNEGHLQAWSLQAHGLHNLALRNLARLGHTLSPDGSLETSDGFAAAHILLLDRLAPGADLLVAIPHRDLLLSAPADRPIRFPGPYLHFSHNLLATHVGQQVDRISGVNTLPLAPPTDLSQAHPPQSG